MSVTELWTDPAVPVPLKQSLSFRLCVGPQAADAV